MFFLIYSIAIQGLQRSEMVNPRMLPDINIIPATSHNIVAASKVHPCQAIT